MDTISIIRVVFRFFFNDTATTEIYTLSLHDALPISPEQHPQPAAARCRHHHGALTPVRSEEHTSELQSRFDLVCRLLLENKKKRRFTANARKKILAIKKKTKIQKNT